MTIPSGIKTPGVYTDVNINTQRAGLLPNTQRVLFITADTPTAAMPTPVDIYDTAQADSKFGVNSVLGRMIKAGIKTNRLVNAQGFSLTDYAGGSGGGQQEIIPVPQISCAGATADAEIHTSQVFISDGGQILVEALVQGSLAEGGSVVNETFNFTMPLNPPLGFVSSREIAGDGDYPDNLFEFKVGRKFAGMGGEPSGTVITLETGYLPRLAAGSTVRLRATFALSESAGGSVNPQLFEPLNSSGAYVWVGNSLHICVEKQ